MKRFAAAVLAAVVACAPALAVTGVDPNGHFEITWPDDWQSGPVDGMQVAVPPAGPDGTQCLGASADHAGSAAMTLDQINAGFSEPLSDEEWRFFTGGGPDQVFEDKVVVDGPLKSQRATTAVSTGDGGTVVLRVAVFIKPGTIVTGSCMTPAESYPALKDLFEQILSTLTPKI
jgi:hypothetical protein